MKCLRQSALEQIEIGAFSITIVYYWKTTVFRQLTVLFWIAASVLVVLVSFEIYADQHSEIGSEPELLEQTGQTGGQSIGKFLTEFNACIQASNGCHICQVSDDGVIDCRPSVSGCRVREITCEKSKYSLG
jgi:hypothetical protein